MNPLWQSAILGYGLLPLAPPPTTPTIQLWFARIQILGEAIMTKAVKYIKYATTFRGGPRWTGRAGSHVGEALFSHSEGVLARGRRQQDRASISGKCRGRLQGSGWSLEQELQKLIQNPEVVERRLGKQPK